MTEPTPRVLFLYTELAGYFMACLQALTSRGVEVHIVRWPVNQEAPFDFADIPGVTLYERADFDEEELARLVTRLDPGLLIVSGWIDKTYVNICKRFSNKLTTVLTSDNHWHGGARQQLARVISPFTIRKNYQLAWVPGQPQVTYVKKLGYADSQIKTGFYSADFEHFKKIYEANKQAKTAAFPKRFLYIGRYLEFKGIFELWQAFQRIRADFPEWELWCFGTGDLYDQRVEADGIRHFGFVQPDELPRYLAESGVFVCPSTKEPWGVVVHELAAAGFPIICSDKVGAAATFVEEGKNGFIHPAGDEKALYNAMKTVVTASQEALVAMADHSATLGHRITPETWADTVQEMMAMAAKTA